MNPIEPIEIENLFEETKQDDDNTPLTQKEINKLLKKFGLGGEKSKSQFKASQRKDVIKHKRREKKSVVKSQRRRERVKR